MPDARVVMCPPEHYELGPPVNPFMDGAEPVDPEHAQAQWQALADVLTGLDVEVHVLEPSPGLADQVFTANPVFAFPTPGGPSFIRSQMRHDVRQPEVDALAGALRRLGLKETHLMGDAMIEGGGDLLWHDGQVWMGHGHRTDGTLVGAVRAATGTRVRLLRLVDPRFYHLDTALCILDDGAALWVPAAFDEDSRQEIKEAFTLLIDVTDEANLLAANAWSIDGEHVVIDGACTHTIQRLAEAGFIPVPVDTSEFRKSGGSVYCMKQVVP